MITEANSFAIMAFRHSKRLVKERNIQARTMTTKHVTPYAHRWTMLHERRIVELANTVIAMGGVLA